MYQLPDEAYQLVGWSYSMLVKITKCHELPQIQYYLEIKSFSKLPDDKTKQILIYYFQD